MCGCFCIVDKEIWIEKFWELQKSSFLDSIGVLVGAPVIAQ